MQGLFISYHTQIWVIMFLGTFITDLYPEKKTLDEVKY